MDDPLQGAVSGSGTMKPAMLTARLNCLVPFCRRSRGDRKNDPVDRYDEYLCGDHWRLVDRRLRRLYRKARRIDRGSVAGYLWGKCRAQALARALP
jgi:hypothetical protein